MSEAISNASAPVQDGTSDMLLLGDWTLGVTVIDFAGVWWDDMEVMLLFSSAIDVLGTAVMIE
jgi:hypothetical protein